MYPVVDLTNRHGIRQQDRMDGFITRRIIQQTREAAPHVFEDGHRYLDQRDGAGGPLYRSRYPRFAGVGRGSAPLRCGVQPLRPTLLFTQSCRAPSMRLRFSIRRAPVTFNAASTWLNGSGAVWSGHCVSGRRRRGKHEPRIMGLID